MSPGLRPLSAHQPSKARPTGKTDASRSRDSRPRSEERAARGCSAWLTCHGALFITRAQEASSEGSRLGKTDGILESLHQGLLSATNYLPSMPYFPPPGLTSTTPPGTEASQTACCSGDRQDHVVGHGKLLLIQPSLNA